MKTDEVKDLMTFVYSLEAAAFQHGKAQNMDMKNRDYFKGLHEDAKSEFLDRVIELVQGDS